MDIDNIQAVIDAARAGVPAQRIEERDGVQWWAVPGAHGTTEIKTIEVHGSGITPRRKTGKVTVFDAASFNRVIADNSDAGNVAIYLDRDPNAPSVVGVLNGNGPAGPGRGDFRVTIQFRPTPQWTKWRAIDGKMLPQVAFAEFIEDNLEDIAEPAGATMLEIATYLETTRTTVFRSGKNLSSGAVQFVHAEDDVAKVGAGQLEIPQSFTLGISPLVGVPSFRIPVRFRWRLTEGKLTLGIKIQRIETLMETVMQDVFAAIVQGEHIAVLEGLPPA